MTESAMRTNPEILTVETAGKTALRKLLKLGIDQGQVWPAFQPIVDIRTGNIASFEVLARWSDPDAGAIHPVAFIPRLEQYGLIGMLSDTLIDRACRSTAAWPGRFSLAFNISPVQLTREDFPHRLAALVSATGFPLNRVEIEVTEGLLISDSDRAYAILRELNELGVNVAIDDFGTGYSSLARLESFPFHKLKIDARFVRGIDAEPAKRRIAAAVIGLGQSLGITVVAEGIETAAEEAILRNLGCDLGQGWLYGKPEPSDKARRKLRRCGGVDASPRPLDASPFQQLHQLASLYDQAPVGLCYMDKDFRHVRANDRFASIHGLKGKDLEGRTVHDLMQGEAAEAVIKVLEESATTDEPVTQQYSFHGRDIRVITNRVLDHGGEVIGFSVVLIDFTEESRMKAILLESEQRLRKELNYADAIIRCLPGVFYYYDEDMRLRRWNQSHEKVTGYTGEELEGKQALEFFPDEEKERIGSAVQQLAAEGHIQIEADILTKDGQRIPLFFSASRFEHDGHMGFVGMGMDVSALKQMERALREKTTMFETMSHASPDGILVLGPDGQRIIQNRRLNEIWKIPDEIASDPDSPRQFEFITRRVRNPAAFLERIEWLQTHPDETDAATVELDDGTVLTQHTTSLYDASGHYYGRVWMFRYLTEDRQEKAQPCLRKPE